MSWSFNTGNRYHTQDTAYYCGAACAMMVLNEIGVAYADLDQDDLYTSNHNHNVKAGWATDPYGLCYTLNNLRPASFLPRYFVVYKPLTEAEGTRDVVHTLQHYQVSPSILVYGCQHWNVVRGVQTDVDPATGPYTVEGFWLNNPIFYSSAPPPPHDGADDCGSGGSHGIANEFVTYATWQTDRFTGCSYDDAGGNRQWISVCDPEARKIALPSHRPIRRLADGRTMVAAKQVSEFAQIGLKEYRLAEHEFAAEALKSGHVGEPLLVQRLDRPGDYYYLSPWEGERGITGFVETDARFGVFKSLRILSVPVMEWLVGGQSNAHFHERIGRLLDGKKFDLPENHGRFTVFHGSYCISPSLVWKPCRESWSPHLPFYHVVIGANALYIRLDGKVFNTLTPGSGG